MVFDRPRIVRHALELLFAGAGIALLVWAWRANPLWFERNVNVLYCQLSPIDLQMAHRHRWEGVVLGALLVLLAPLCGWWAGRHAAGFVRWSARIGGAVLAALVMCEGVLRIVQPPPQFSAYGRHAHPRYGWLFTASTTETGLVGGREVEAAINSEHNRAPSTQWLPDPARPTILLTGASMTWGHALPYQETVGALLERDLGIQSVNVAVSGYANDQAYLRLIDALPRFQHPVALVTFFHPIQLAYNLRNDRPHLILNRHGDLELVPAATGFWANLRLGALWRKATPYHSDETLRIAAAVFRDTAEKARARGAAAVFIGTNFGPPCMRDRDGLTAVERELFVRQNLRYAWVENDPSWAVAGDTPPFTHPDVRGSRAFVQAIERLLNGAVSLHGKSH